MFNESYPSSSRIVLKPHDRVSKRGRDMLSFPQFESSKASEGVILSFELQEDLQAPISFC